MKLKVKVMNALVESRTFRDNRTGNQQQREMLTIAGLTDDGEMISASIYLDSKPDSLPSGHVLLDVYRYEASSPLLGSVSARSFSPVAK